MIKQLLIFLLVFTASPVLGEDCKDFRTRYLALESSEMGQSERLSRFYMMIAEAKADSCISTIQDLYSSIGIIQVELNLMEDALESFELQLKWAVRSGDNENISGSYQNIGFWYMLNEQQESAVTPFIKALDLLEGIEQDQERLSLYRNIGVAYYHIEEIDSAIYYGQKLLDLANELGDEEAMITAVQLTAVIQMEQEGATQDVIKTLKECLRRFDGIGDLESRYMIMSNLGEAYEMSNVLDSAVHYYGEAVRIAEDDLNSVDYLSSMSEKINSINLLISEREKQKTAWLIGLGVALVLLAFLSMLIIRNRQQKVQLADLRHAEMVAAKERENAEAMLLGQDAERRRISEDLHDRLGGMLASLKVHFSSLAPHFKTDGQDGNKDFERAGLLIDDTATEVRRISHDLYSSVLVKFGLIPALDELSETLQLIPEIDFHWSFTNMEERLGKEMEMVIYRVIQECTTNIIKHSKASEATIQLVRHEDSVSLIIEDNGVGYNPDVQKKDSGIGMLTIQSRVERLSGSFVVDSNVNSGTIILIDLPLTI